ncbi:hypothetical protein AMAG_09641 [Allomyces macrogynus ATCC 38327]|uniref:Uncharacterized protein n=1 Tax=Allomyces macrogynus (strain ATCC 38327) TaxID=578462 RepID=A0A0L0STL0_ALLM3|nr:hypothetical protein AMAG_09641 [Allomyces macrogynus ATCC 38327]|eukprot:KNE65659.1 hypothetical protein AMAG_09641 [Allomyces macrogynus ATCC 38327]
MSGLPPFNPADFGLGGDKAPRSTGTAADWDRAFESSSSSASASLRAPVDPVAVAHQRATSEDTFRAFAEDGSAVLAVLHADSDPVFQLNFEMTAPLDDVDKYDEAAMRAAWQLPPTPVSRVQEGPVDAWARDFLLADGEAVAAYLKSGAYLDEVWGLDAVDAWERAIDGWAPPMRPKGEVEKTEERAVETEARTVRAVDRLRALVGQLRFSPMRAAGKGEPGSEL